MIGNYSRRTRTHRCRLYQLPEAKNLPPWGELHPPFSASRLIVASTSYRSPEIDVDVLNDSLEKERKREGEKKKKKGKEKREIELEIVRLKGAFFSW